MSSHLVHHVGIAVRDMDASLRFYRDGLGFEVILDEHFDRDWMRLAGSPAKRMHAVVLANPANMACPIELIAFEDDVDRPPVTGPPSGLFLLSIQVDDLDAATARLAELGFGGFEPDHNDVGGASIDLVFLRDPDGMVVELASAASVAQMQL